MKSAEQLCMEYAIAKKEEDAQTSILREKLCVGSHVDQDYDCLDMFFQAPRGSRGEFPRFSEFYDPMCVNCKRRLEAIEARKAARRRLGAIKKSIFAMGRKINDRNH